MSLEDCVQKCSCRSILFWVSKSLSSIPASLLSPGDRFLRADPGGNHRRGRFWESLPCSVAGLRGGGEGGTAGPRRGRGADSGERASGGQTLRHAQPSQHHGSAGGVSAGAQPVSGHGVRPGRPPQPGPRWETHPSVHAGGLGGADRPGHPLPPQPGHRPHHSPRPQVQQQ